MNALDEKLCKSLLPEINKVFCGHLTQRSYKICGYDAQVSGNFMMHEIPLTLIDIGDSDFPRAQ